MFEENILRRTDSYIITSIRGELKAKLSPQGLNQRLSKLNMELMLEFDLFTINNIM